jgi:hypothetical protein
MTAARQSKYFTAIFVSGLTLTMTSGNIAFKSTEIGASKAENTGSACSTGNAVVT